jgi:hydroxyacylglutathione hydrolase
MRAGFAALAILWGLMVCAAGHAQQIQPGTMDVHWDEGAPNCAGAAKAPLQVHPYNGTTYILRENLCTTFEAPFMYLLIGSTRALLIDTGDVADPKVVPLADTVVRLLPEEGGGRLPLLVVHTHRHLDHRAGDVQFAHLPNVQVVGYTIESVRQFYNFAEWPKGMAQLDLGNRIVDALPTPGHNQTEVSFYDRNTALFFSGDFLMPARLLIDNTSADLASAERVTAFVKDRPVSFVLGGHIEMNSAGKLYDWESQYHPHEHVLQMSKEDLLALPTVVGSFNGFYTVRGKCVMEDSMRILAALAIGFAIVLVALVWMVVRWVRRRRKVRVGA